MHARVCRLVRFELVRVFLRSSTPQDNAPHRRSTKALEVERADPVVACAPETQLALSRDRFLESLAAIPLLSLRRSRVRTGPHNGADQDNLLPRNPRPRRGRREERVASRPPPWCSRVCRPPSRPHQPPVGAAPSLFEHPSAAARAQHQPPPRPTALLLSLSLSRARTLARAPPSSNTIPQNQTKPNQNKTKIKKVVKLICEYKGLEWVHEDVDFGAMKADRKAYPFGQVRVKTEREGRIQRGGRPKAHGQTHTKKPARVWATPRCTRQLCF